MQRLKQVGEIGAFYAGVACLGLLSLVIGWYAITHFIPQ
jgi:hypothetical protein